MTHSTPNAEEQYLKIENKQKMLKMHNKIQLNWSNYCEISTLANTDNHTQKICGVF